MTTNNRGIDLAKLKHWLTSRGAEILPTTNEYESVRFKGREVGVLYKSGKVSNTYTQDAINCFRGKKKWNGGPIPGTRKGSYKKEKIALLKRDGDCCFYCGKRLLDDITLEHLIALSSGGKNILANMVLCHEQCNHEVGNLPLHLKVELAIKKRNENGFL